MCHTPVLDVDDLKQLLTGMSYEMQNNRSLTGPLLSSANDLEHVKVKRKSIERTTNTCFIIVSIILVA